MPRTARILPGFGANTLIKAAPLGLALADARHRDGLQHVVSLLHFVGRISLFLP